VYKKATSQWLVIITSRTSAKRWCVGISPTSQIQYWGLFEGGLLA